MLLIYYEINLILSWFVNWIIFISAESTTLAITGAKRYVRLSIQNKENVLQQMKSGFKQINWNKYQSNVSTKSWNQYSDYLIVLSF